MPKRLEISLISDFMNETMVFSMLFKELAVDWFMYVEFGWLALDYSDGTFCAEEIEKAVYGKMARTKRAINASLFLLAI